ncbi:MAG: TatD family hydrolase [Sulfolobales archaeon]|nr:TatD family hydrolase [Sulfolobales archaeon]MCX8208424.1 TatD family hydrolase [Sulfolobales archaeon]MDW8010727.1 TatD family hydrolase [Sulfolobales archaeon]
MVEWFVDSHAHASPLGLGYEEVVRRFKQAGGKLIVLVQLTPGSYGFESNLEGVVRSLEVHVGLCGRVRSEYGSVLCFGGLHPAVADRLARSSKSVDWVLAEIERNYMRKLRDILIGGLLDGLGEFGRPHYPAPPESWALNELLLVKSLELARDLDKPVHVHSENSGLVTLESLKFFVDKVGVPRRRVLVHHVPPSQVPIYSREGFYVSVVGKLEVARSVGSECSNVLVESDYLDDPRRPGAVAYPWEIRREVLKAVEEGSISEHCGSRILALNPAEFYGTTG